MDQLIGNVAEAARVIQWARAGAVVSVDRASQAMVSISQGGEFLQEGDAVCGVALQVLRSLSSSVMPSEDLCIRAHAEVAALLERVREAQGDVQVERMRH